MKTIACAALKPGMELGRDVFSYKNELLFPAGTVLKDAHLRKLKGYSIMCVTIREAQDYATTHFEKLRLSGDFQHFEKVYAEYLSKYKTLMINFIDHGAPVYAGQLMYIYTSVSSCVKSGDLLLDYLYNMLPNEDDMTHAHCLNSALIAGVFAGWLGLSEEETDTLIQCGFFYDIGKLKLPDALIWKPGRLTELEYTKIKTHTFTGFELLKDMDWNPHIANAALMHHERCDGSGYPSRLKSNKIDRFAKYIAIIDSYEAMTSARIYRQSLHPFQVIANFESDGFLIFDETILRPILAHIAAAQVGYTARLNDGRTAQIGVINQQQLSRPLLQADDGTRIDLSRDPSLMIEAIY